MGTDEAAPVDTNLRLRAVRNLRVMDCSVLPIMVAGNTNAPIMAMAARGADLMLEEKH
jgi:choline dehydrogenase-like flavoprotein